MNKKNKNLINFLLDDRGDNIEEYLTEAGMNPNQLLKNADKLVKKWKERERKKAFQAKGEK